jgi:hypothetical protein
MADPIAFVIVTERRGREAVDTEVRVRSLEELYEACRNAPASRVVRVSLKGPDGEVRLNFASFITRS